ncbi:MAG: thioesterase family protein [Myxococcaceae bacterium]
MSSEFERASATERVREGLWRAQIPEGWEQGRGAFGGLVLGTLVRAMEAERPDPSRTLRTLTGDLCGPVLAREAELEVEVLRHGARTTFIDARLRQGGRVQARASAVFAQPLAETRATVPEDPPDAPPWTAVDSVPVGPPFGPVFSQHYDYRITGPFPLSGGTEAVAEGYIREKDPPAVLDTPTLIGRVDAWWPALLTVESAVRPMATVSFTAEITADLTTIPGAEPLFHRARVVAIRDGLTVEFRELWHGRTRVAMNQQTFAVLG